MHDPVTVVIATRDRPALLQGALASVARCTGASDSVIVVDSASLGAAAIRAVAESAGAQVLRAQRPGTSRARNLGWRAATTDIVAFMDDDCRPEPDWLDRLSAAFTGRDDVGFVTGQVREDDGTRRRGELTLSVFDLDEGATYEAGADVTDMGHGANVAFRRGLLARLDGFDESMGPGTELKAAEDQDLFWRALRSGAKGCFEPSAVVIHRHWRNRRQQLRTVYAYGVGSGALSVKQARVATTEAETLTNSRQTGLRRVEGKGVGRALRRAGTHVMNGYQMGALAEMVFVAGFVPGAARARRMALDGDRFSR